MDTSKEYQITKKQCQERIKKIDGVCEGCGGKLEPIETVDNAGQPTYWVCCKHCMCFRGGIKKKYWEIARLLVMKYGEYKYSYRGNHTKTKEELEYWLNSETVGISNLVRKVIYLFKNPEELPNKEEWLEKWIEKNDTTDK